MPENLIKWDGAELSMSDARALFDTFRDEHRAAYVNSAYDVANDVFARSQTLWDAIQSSLRAATSPPA